MVLRYFTLSSSLCAETIGGAWEVRLEKNMERVRAMIGMSFYLYEVGGARAPKDFPWWTAGMKIDPKKILFNKGPGARAGHFPSFFSLFYNARNPFFSKIHSFSKPVPLPPVRKWQTDLPETRKCAVSQTKKSLILSL